VKILRISLLNARPARIRIRDMFIAWITLKFTQSNSVCYVVDGQTIGVGAGQQSRVHCARLAGSKADLWRLRQHPSVMELPFKEGIKRPDRDNAIDQFLQPDVTAAEKKNWSNVFTTISDQLTDEERRAWLDELNAVVLGSDAFFPFRDGIDRACEKWSEVRACNPAAPTVMMKSLPPVTNMA
jgi:phosphoribosylaminoimidazolecarboxamide formyltransferase/IMP cyclohydrolase